MRIYLTRLACVLFLLAGSAAAQHKPIPEAYGKIVGPQAPITPKCVYDVHSCSYSEVAILRDGDHVRILSGPVRASGGLDIYQVQFQTWRGWMATGWVLTDAEQAEHDAEQAEHDAEQAEHDAQAKQQQSAMLAAFAAEIDAYKHSHRDDATVYHVLVDAYNRNDVQAVERICEKVKAYGLTCLDLGVGGPPALSPETTPAAAGSSKAFKDTTSIGCAENGSCYGDLNKNGVPKTVRVQGYTRKDGTYVRGYYRSAPGTNPKK